MMIYLNVALHADFPVELEEAFKLGKEEEMSAWAMAELQKLIDGEDAVEFGAQLLGMSVRGGGNE
jgi:hypothetical protein